MRNTNLMVSVYDRDLKIRFWNASTEKKFNIPFDEANGKCLSELFPGYDKDFRFQVMKDAVELQKSFYFPDLPYQYQGGSYSQLIIPTQEGIAIVSSDNDGNNVVARRALLEAVV